MTVQFGEALLHGIDLDLNANEVTALDVARQVVVDILRCTIP